MPVVAPWGAWVSVVTPDGETLAALHSPSADGMPTVLFFPGNGDNIVHYGFLARRFAAQGYGFFALSYRGYPGSTGSPSESGLLIDGLASFDWLAGQSAAPIILLGRSLGTGVAVYTAAERQAAMLILVSSYDSVLSIARSRFPFVPVGLLIRDSFRSDLRIARVSEPKLFLHGRRDGVIPLASGEALFDAAAEPKELRVEEGHGHGDIWSPELISHIIRFADANLAAIAH